LDLGELVCGFFVACKDRRAARYSLMFGNDAAAHRTPPPELRTRWFCCQPLALRRSQMTARIAPVDSAHADEPTQQLFAAVKAQMGKVPNMMKTMAHSP